MGGSPGRVVSGIATGGLSELGRSAAGNSTAKRALLAGGTGGLSEFVQRNPFGVPINNPLALFGRKSDGSQAVPGPFELDQTQFEGDRNAINQEGQRQYDATIKGLGDVSAANTKRAQDLFSATLPNIAENANAAHLYDSTGYGNEVARQQSEIASRVASDEAQQKQAALSGLQGFQTGALQRGLSMEDFINQANVAKTIGAQMAPQAPSSKATGLSGGVAGAGAGANFGPLGAGLGGIGGLIMGSNANKRGGK